MSAALDPTALTANAILKIDRNEPERLFPKDEAEDKKLYRKLAIQWHPDRNKTPDAAVVFTHIEALHTAAKEKRANDTWQAPGLFTCKLENGKTFRVRADAVRPFDIGTLYINPTTATYVVKKDYVELFENGLSAIKNLNFPDVRIKEVYYSRVPAEHKVYRAIDANIMTVRKQPDDILLRDLIPHLPPKGLDRHVAWITSRLHELVRFLDFNDLTHNAITADTLFVSPENHTAALFGGWWYAAHGGKVIEYAAEESLDYLPQTTPVLANTKLDLDMVRAISRELLGDRGGTRFLMTKPAPEPMLYYLRSLSSGVAQKDLETWYEKVLPKSFGPRRFEKLDVSYNDVYSPAL